MILIVLCDNKVKNFNSSLEWPIILVIISNKPLVTSWYCSKYDHLSNCITCSHVHFMNINIQFIWIIVMIDI